MERNSGVDLITFDGDARTMTVRVHCVQRHYVHDNINVADRPLYRVLKYDFCIFAL